MQLILGYLSFSLFRFLKIYFFLYSILFHTRIKLYFQSWMHSNEGLHQLHHTVYTNDKEWRYFDESIIFSFFKFLFLLIFHIISPLSRVTKRWKLRPEQARQNTTTIVVSAPYENKTTLSSNIVSVFEWILFINTTVKQNRLLTSLS